MAPRKFLKRITPKSHEVKDHPWLRHFGELLHHPNLWHINRKSAAGGVAAGFFFAFFPIPIQMVLSASCAILFKVNLPVALFATWISNPITIVPMMIFAYNTGAWILGIETNGFTIEWTWEWFSQQLVDVWEPLFLGGFICGAMASLTGYLFVRTAWRLWVMLHWHKRKRRHKK